MERSEPSLVPEWLKYGGNVSSSLRSDDHTVSRRSRNKSYINSSNHDLGRTSVFDRTASSYFRRSSSSNGSHESYSSFAGNIRDKELNKDIHHYGGRHRSVVAEHRHLDDFNAIEHIGLNRSQSMIYCKREVTWPRKVSFDVSSANKNNYNNGNGIDGRGSLINGVHKTVRDRDFPHLGAEESQMASEIGRLPSPGLTTAIPSLLVGGDKWTSVLAELPVIVGSNGTLGSCTQQDVLASSAPVASNTAAVLNMAEALAQGPDHAQVSPKLSIETQRFEELAIKQSKQLIPVIPSMPKSLVSNTSEKVKPKFLQRQNQTSSPCDLPMKLNLSKSLSAGKVHVLKSAQERNAAFPATKDSMSPRSSKAVNSPLASSSSVFGSTSKSQGNTPALANAERNSPFVVLEKRPVSQSQSRSDFFNLMRKKSMINSSSAISEPGLTASPPVLNKLGEAEAAAVAPVLDSDVSLWEISSEDGASDNKGVSFNDNGDADIESPKSLYSATNSRSGEEETAFLRSLGWDENGGDDGLTEEEINAFYEDARKYINSRPMQKLWSKGRLPEEEKGNNQQIIV